MDNFLVNAVCAGLATSFATAPMGCFLLWRRMAFFADTLAHSAILGVALGVLLHLSPLLATTLFVLGLSLGLMRVTEKRSLPVDTWLAIVAYGALSLAMIVFSLAPSKIDPERFLFGDILLSQPFDAMILFGIAVVNTLFFKCFWRDLVLMSLNESLAFVEGVQVRKIHRGLIALLSLTIAVSMKVVGALLIPALLMIPAATAHRLARTPMTMMFWALACSMLFVMLGIYSSVYFDIPTGPSIICCGTLIFFIVSYVKSKR